jgi:hypothetical protein
MNRTSPWIWAGFIRWSESRVGKGAIATTEANQGVTTMPRAWTAKDERQYEHVKESELERGRSEDRAKEVAARTVNAQRRDEGRTPNESNQGTGNPNTRLEDRTRRQLYNRAKELDIEGRSGMSKSQLIRAIRQRE